MEPTKPIQILLIEDSPIDAEIIMKTLRRSEGVKFEVTRAEWLSTGLMLVANRSFDLVLLDLSLPDYQGIDTIVHFMESNVRTDLPIIVLTGYDDLATGIQAVRYGAQDYLVKNEIQSKSLDRAILYAIERRRADLAGKQLMRTSIASMAANEGSDLATNGMLRSHVMTISRLMKDLRQFVATNAPAQTESVEALLGKHSADVVLREMKDILQISDEAIDKTVRRRSMSEAALAAVRSVSKSDEPTNGTPRDNILEAIASREKYMRSHDG